MMKFRKLWTIALSLLLLVSGNILSNTEHGQFNQKCYAAVKPSDTSINRKPPMPINNRAKVVHKQDTKKRITAPQKKKITTQSKSNTYSNKDVIVSKNTNSNTIHRANVNPSNVVTVPQRNKNIKFHIPNINTNKGVNVSKRTNSKAVHNPTSNKTNAKTNIYSNNQKNWSLKSGYGLKGDVNSDGQVTATDLSQLKMVLLGQMSENQINRQNADINGDNKITSTDLSLLKQLVVKQGPTTTYKVVNLYFDDLDSWVKELNRAQSSVTTLGQYVTYGSGKQFYTGTVITGMNIRKYKNITVKVPYGQGPEIKRYVNKIYSLPEIIEFRLHKHDIKNKFFFNVSYFHFWQECECGYRDEWFWDVPWPDVNDDLAQNTKSVIKALPRQKVVRMGNVY